MESILKNAFIAGFVAGEGHFEFSYNKTGKTPNMRVIIGLHVNDAPILYEIVMILGGYVKYPKCRPDSVRWQINGYKNAISTIIPFMDNYLSLIMTNKYKQYMVWRKKVTVYIEDNVKQSVKKS